MVVKYKNYTFDLMEIKYKNKIVPIKTIRDDYSLHCKVIVLDNNDGTILIFKDHCEDIIDTIKKDYSDSFTVKLDEMKLPKVNQRKQQSKVICNKLENKIRKLIDDFQEENIYKFESYEIDNIFLKMIKGNHESYLRTKFGDDTI